MKHKRLLSAITAVCLAVSFAGCSKPKENNPTATEVSGGGISFLSIMTGNDSIEKTGENYVNYRVSWDEIKLSPEDAEKFPKLAETFKKINDDSADASRDTLESLQADEEYYGGNEENPWYLYCDTSFSMQRADSAIVSFRQDIDSYTGGVHPNFACFGKNYSPETGKELLVTDVLTDIEELPGILEEEICSKYDYPEFEEWQLTEIFEAYSPADYQWTMDYQGITFWFSPYEIASYAMGTLSVKLFFDDKTDLFNEEYTTTPSGNYVVALPFYHDISIDLVPDDGKKDKIYLETTYDMYGEYQKLVVCVNDQKYTDEVNYAYGFEVYLMHTGGKNYICYDLCEENDYHMLCTLDINGDSIVPASQLYRTQLYYEYEDRGSHVVQYHELLNNPDDFALTTRFDILGTRNGNAQYKINGADGTIQMMDEYYTVDDDHEIVAMIPLEVKLLPDMTDTEILPGTKLTAVRTDTKTYIDMKTDDGKEVRLDVDISDWPRKVNGIPEEECFDKLFYAG